jgi:hypothetical protein
VLGRIGIPRQDFNPQKKFLHSDVQSRCLGLASYAEPQFGLCPVFILSFATPLDLAQPFFPPGVLTYYAIRLTQYDVYQRPFVLQHEGLPMKYFALAALLAIGLALAGCGANNSSNPANINGTWNATLLDTNNTTVFSFGTSLVVNGDGSLTISNFQFNSNSSCFVSGETESGSFTLMGNTNGQVNGRFGLAVQSGSPGGNSLTLSGTANGNTVSGTWTLTGGSGCTGSGSFTMVKG